MKKKGFSLVELIIVMGITGIIALIAVPSFTGIQNRSAISADKSTGSQIGKAFELKEVDLGDTDSLVNMQTRYDEVANIETYISKDYKPQSMKDGYYVVSQVDVDGQRYLMVGITKDGTDGQQMAIGETVYDGGETPGWVWSQWGDVKKFLNKNGDKFDMEADAVVKHEEEVSYIKNASTSLKTLIGKVESKKANKAIEKVYDLLHSSPAKSNMIVRPIEMNIISRIDCLQTMVMSNDEEAIIAETKELEMLIEQRNAKLKLNQ